MTCDCSAGQPSRSRRDDHLANSIFADGYEDVSTKDHGYGCQAEENHLVSENCYVLEDPVLARQHFATFVNACYTTKTMADVQWAAKMQSQLLYHCRTHRHLLPPRSLSLLS